MWGLNGHLDPEGLRALQANFGITVVQTATTDPRWAVDTLLPRLREAGLQVTLRLTGDHPRYTDARGDFDLAAWEAQLDRWAPEELAPFIADGTLAGHMLLDDIANFEGRDPDAADLDEMARASKARLPGLMTFVRERATALPEPVGGRYLHVDAAVNQYKAQHGDAAAFASAEAARCRALGLGVINGLNIANGGDGSSGQPGWAEGRFAMSGEEILRAGTPLATTPGLGMFLVWEYDGEERWSDGSVGSDYFDQPAQAEALDRLGRLVSEQPAITLLRAPAPG